MSDVDLEDVDRRLESIATFLLKCGDGEMCKDVNGARKLLRSLARERDSYKASVLLHPNGKCTCYGEGRCPFCVWSSANESLANRNNQLEAENQRLAARVAELREALDLACEELEYICAGCEPASRTREAKDKAQAALARFQEKPEDRG